MKYKQFLLTSICCLLVFSANANEADTKEFENTVETTSSKDYYNLPNEATCKNNYCVDNNNEPITGTIRRYKNGFLVREYVTKDGYLEGISRAYYESGKIKSERNYKMGKLNGNVSEYDKNGKITENIAYKNGKKDGIARYYNDDNIIKLIYIDNNMNGDAQVWDKNNSQMIYKLKMKNNQTISGTYIYKDNASNTEIPLSQLIIDGINNQCLELQNKQTSSTCMINIEPIISILSNSKEQIGECNKEWLKQNKLQLAKYIKECKCNDLKNEIKEVYEDNNREKSVRKELLLKLKEKYEKHCMESNE